MFNGEDMPVAIPLYQCDDCAEDICVGDDYYDLGGICICEDCIYSYKCIAEEEGLL